jgi:hypothetical protein
MLGNMNRTKDQLLLLEAPDERWRLDPETREVGRRGLERARQALADARSASRKAA